MGLKTLCKQAGRVGSGGLAVACVISLAMLAISLIGAIR
jgi:hypothetical protein